MFRTCVLALLSCSGSVDSTLLKLADCYDSVMWELVSDLLRHFTHNVLLCGSPLAEGWQDEHDLVVGNSKVV